MAKLTKDFRGVRDGEIYPVDFAAGDECPPELEAGARSLGALEDAPAPAPAPEADATTSGAPAAKKKSKD